MWLWRALAADSFFLLSCRDKLAVLESVLNTVNRCLADWKKIANHRTVFALTFCFIRDSECSQSRERSMLSQIKARIAATEITPLRFEAREARAAVLLALTDIEDDPQVVLTKRAEHLSSHSGEVSLPGGKCDPEDSSFEQTALRETWEEIGLPPEQVEVLSPLHMIATRQGVPVAPYVGIVPAQAELIPNPDELDAIFHLPLSFLLADNRIRTDIYHRDGLTFWSPAYEFEGYEVWGFTARLLVEFANSFLDAGIGRRNSAPIKDWGEV